MSDDAALEPRAAEELGSEGRASLVVLSPVLALLILLVAHLYFPDIYRWILHELGFLGLFAPGFALFWVLYCIRYFCPKYLPGPLSSDSAHLRRAVGIRNICFWTAIGCLVGAFVLGDRHRAAVQVFDLLGKLGWLAMCGAITLNAYVQLRAIGRWTHPGYPRR